MTMTIYLFDVHNLRFPFFVILYLNPVTG